MENFLFNVLLAFPISVALLWGYWAAFYPALILKARFRMASIQDEVRFSALHNKALARTRAYFEFEHFLLISRRVVQYHDVLGLYAMNPPAHELADIEERIRSISEEPELRVHFRELTRWMMVVRMVSAPAFLFIGTILAILSQFSDWAKKLIEKKEKEVFTLGERLPA